MASREASLKVTLKNASFQSGLRKMESSTKTAGTRMGRSLSAGFNSAKQSLGGMLSGLKSGISIAATLGGALSFAGMAKDAIQMQNTYRNIAFNVNKISTNSQNWEDIQKMITGAVMSTGRSADELSEAFTDVFEATGDFEYARKAMYLVGETATATGHSTKDLANVMQMSYRKFGTGMEDAEEAMSRFVGLTGTGGAGLSDMTGKFALMAGEAVNAGMEGTAGISQMLGMLQLLDSSIGEKAVPGLKMMFQAVKGGSTQFLQLEKAMKSSGVAFKPDMSAMDKILATLQSAKGRKAGEMIFTADARVVYDELAKPFDEAMEQALAAGFSKKDAMDKGIKAFNQNLEDAAQSTLEYSDIVAGAAGRQVDDPMVKMNKAMARISEAFTNPKMIGAMNKLADKMPAFADAVTWAITTLLDNPWESIATMVAVKVGLAFAGTAISTAFAGGVKAMFAKQAAASVVASAATAVGGGAAVAGGGAAAAGGLAAAGLATTVAAGAAAGAAGFLGTREILEMTGMDKSLEGVGAAIFDAISGNPLEATPAGQRTAGGGTASNRKEEEKASKAMESLAKHTAQAAKAMQAAARTAGAGAGTARRPLEPADPTPGAQPTGG